MKRVFLVGTVLALVAALLGGSSALATDSSLPGGTSISVDVDQPESPAFVEPTDDVVVSGSASVGEGIAVKNTTVVYVLDVSGSARNGAGVDCNGDERTDTIIACEVAAVRAVNDLAEDPNSPVKNSGIGTFSGSGSANTIDADPKTGTHDLLAAPDKIDDALDVAVRTGKLTPSGGTDFGEGLVSAQLLLNDPQAASTKIVVFLTDGRETVTSPPLVLDATIFAFAIGGSGCSTELMGISDHCSVVTAIDTLPDVIGESIGSTLDSVELSIDGGTGVALTTTPGTPVIGPATVTFNESIGTLPIGTHEVCATANGTDAGGSGSVQECVTVESATAVVDCQESSCSTALSDGAGSTARVQGINFDDSFAARPALEECEDGSCRTAFDVLFDEEKAGDGFIVIRVKTPRRNSTPPRQAAVFIDGVEVTNRCRFFIQRSEFPCRNIYRNWKGQTVYRVGTEADPRFSFR